MLFNTKKVSINKDKTKDGFKYYVDFGKLKSKREFKIKLIMNLFPEDLIIAVIDTSLMYSETDNDRLPFKVKELCERNSIEYKCIKAKKEDKGIFGAKIKIGEGVRGFDYIFGLLLNRDKIEKISNIFNEYNSSFYAVKNPDILQDFDLDYRNMEYNLNVFIDNFMDTAAITSKNDQVRAVLEKVRDEFI